MRRIDFKNIINYIPIGLALLFVLLSVVHQSLDGAEYTNSILVPIVLLGAILLSLLTVILLVAVLVLWVKRDWVLMKYGLINTIGVALLTWLGISIDASTILYMT